mgnify:CR=1 FL=1
MKNVVVLGGGGFIGGHLSKRLKDNGTKYYDEPYLRFKGTKYEQETFFVKDPNENVLEIKTLTANPG